jgi:hypothetical protein
MKDQKPVAQGSGKSGSGPGNVDSTVSTMEILHHHTVGATRREKIVIPFVLLGVGVVLAYAGSVLWDHRNHDYHTVTKVEEVVASAEAQARRPPATGLKAFLNPSDAQYVQVALTGWQFWNGKNAISQGYYLRFPDLKTESVEAMVKGERGAGTVLIKLDLSKSTPPRYFVEDIQRGGLPTGETSRTLEIYPLTAASRPAIGSDPAAYRESDGIVYDQDATLKGMTRFAAAGRLQSGEGGLWIQSRRFSVALDSSIDPGLKWLLEDLANTRLSDQVTYFVSLEETYPLKENGKPGIRATTQQIGKARLDGVALGSRFYFANAAGEGARTPVS